MSHDDLDSAHLHGVVSFSVCDSRERNVGSIVFTKWLGPYLIGLEFQQRNNRASGPCVTVLGRIIQKRQLEKDAAFGDDAVEPAELKRGVEGSSGSGSTVIKLS